MDIGRTPSNDPYHLPTNIRPTHYELAIKTDLKALTFHGYVKISLDVVVNTSKIVLNTSHIILGPTYIYSFASKTEQPAIVPVPRRGHKTLFDYQRMTYTFKEAELKIPFHSTLADTTKGYCIPVLRTESGIGLLQDAFALSKASLTILSSCLTLVNSWKHEEEYIVWKVTEGLNRFRRSLFVPLVARLGYKEDGKELTDTGLLRTLTVGQALDAGDEGVIAELRGRFDHYMHTGDDSKIPVDLQRATFIAAVKYGERKEYDTMIKIIDNPKTPLEKIAAIYGMAAPQDPVLLEETTEYITEKARGQDLVAFVAFMAANFKARKLLTRYFKDEYEALYKRLENNWTLGYFIKYCFEFYSGENDRKEIEEFFKDKDTSKCSQSLAQALDNIRAKAAYVEHSTEDLIAWLSRD